MKSDNKNKSQNKANNKFNIIDKYKKYFSFQFDNAYLKLVPIKMSDSRLMQKIESFYEYQTKLIIKKEINIKENIFVKNIISYLALKYNKNQVIQYFLDIIYTVNLLKDSKQEVLFFSIFIDDNDANFLLYYYLYVRNYFKLLTNWNFNSFLTNDPINLYDYSIKKEFCLLILIECLHNIKKGKTIISKFKTIFTQNNISYYEYTNFVIQNISEIKRNELNINCIKLFKIDEEKLNKLNKVVKKIHFEDNIANSLCLKDEIKADLLVEINTKFIVYIKDKLFIDGYLLNTILSKFNKIFYSIASNNYENYKDNLNIKYKKDTKDEDTETVYQKASKIINNDISKIDFTLLFDTLFYDRCINYQIKLLINIDTNNINNITDYILSNTIENN